MSCENGHGSLSCEEIFAKLSEYLDGELDETVCEQLEGHMGSCEPCQRFLESLRNTVSLFHDERPSRMPEGLRSKVCEAFRNFKSSSSGGEKLD